MRRFSAAVAVIVTIAACTPEAAQEPAAATHPAPPAAPAVVEHVVDGDSVIIVSEGVTREVRLIGINAPEMNECWADEATTALEGLLADTDLSIDVRDLDQYGRSLAYLYAGTTSVNRAMLLDGDAIAMAVRHDQLPDFLAAESEAVDLERGLWSPTVCGSGGDASTVRFWAIEPDAPGRDDRNPNGEFVAITNEGAPVDLSRWVLRDESSVHRYAFPDGYILDSGAIVSVRSGCGDDTATDLYWCADGTVWTNSGDTALLLDAHGAVVDRERYFGD